MRTVICKVIERRMTRGRFISLSQVVERHYEELRRFVARFSGSPSLAEDVVQEAWVRARNTGADLPDNPRAYVYRMARNLALDHLKKQSAREARQAPEPISMEVACDAPLVDRVVSAREELAKLEAAIAELPPRRRQVFLLYRGQGLSMREISERLSIAPKTVENHIALAMVHCRQRMKDAGIEI